MELQCEQVARIYTGMPVFRPYFARIFVILPVFCDFVQVKRVIVLFGIVKTLPDHRYGLLLKSQPPPKDPPLVFSGKALFV